MFGTPGGAQTYLLRQMINADDEVGVAIPGFSPTAISLPALLFLVVFEFVILADSNGVLLERWWSGRGDVGTSDGVVGVECRRDEKN